MHFVFNQQNTFEYIFKEFIILISNYIRTFGGGGCVPFTLYMSKYCQLRLTTDLILLMKIIIDLNTYKKLSKRFGQHTV